MFEISLKLTQKAPPPSLLLLALVAFIGGLLNLSGLVSGVAPTIKFYSRIDNLSSAAFQKMDSQLPRTLQLTNQLKTYTLLTRENYPGDFVRHFLTKAPMDLFLGVSLVIFYLTGIFFHKNNLKNAKFFANLGLIISFSMILYPIYYSGVFSGFIYSEILGKYSQYRLNPESDVSRYVIAGIFATFVFYNYRQALYKPASPGHQLSP
jgi:hypothetical protein